MKQREQLLIYPFSSIEYNEKRSMLKENPYVSGQREAPSSCRKANQDFWIVLPGMV